MRWIPWGSLLLSSAWAIDFQQLLDNMDLSRDGTIHWDEVRHSEGYTRLPQDAQKKFKKAFKRSDANKDLVLTLDEFEVWYRKTQRIMEERDIRLVNEARAKLKEKDGR
ncbi:unnamed protein product [Effrenium voratum]|nr:unnamed protein product [Effrenium voratum]